MEGNITWAALAYFLGIAATMFGIVSVVWRMASGRIVTLEKSLTDFKLKVSEEYLRSEHLEKFEHRFLAGEARTLAAIEHLTKRIDMFLNKVARGGHGGDDL